MKTKITFDSARDSSTSNRQGGMSLLVVFTLLSLGVLGSGCGYGGYPASTGGGWSVPSVQQCSDAVFGATVRSGNFTGCILNSEDLSNTDFSYTDFDRADLGNAKFWRDNYSQPALLEGAKFTNVNANSADFTNADLTGADFRSDTSVGTDLGYAMFDGATLDRARMNGADLSGAYFTGGATLNCANLRDADLRNVDFTGASLVNADLTGALIDAKTDFTGADVNGACFSPGSGAVLTGAVNASLTQSTAATCVPLQ